MPLAGDPSLSGLALPLSHNPLQRIGYTSQLPYLDPAVLAAAEQKAIADFLVILDQQTGIDLTGWWSSVVAQQNANQAFSDAIKTAIDSYAGWDTFWAQFSAAWNTWIAVSLQAPSFDVNGFLASMFGIDPATGLTGQNQIAGLSDQFNQIGAAFSGDTTNSGDWTWLANIMVNWFDISTLAHTTSVNNANTLDIQDNKPFIYGLEATTESNILWSPKPDAIALGVGADLFTFVRCAQTSVKNTVAFEAGSTLLPTSFLVNVYKVDFANSKLAFLGQNTGLEAELGLRGWIEPSAFATAVEPGDVIAVCFLVPSGPSGASVTLYGVSASDPSAPRSTINLPAIAATGTPPGGSPYTADVPFSALTFDNSNVPYVGLETSAPPPPTYPDFTTTITTPGTTTFTPDPWALHLDLIGLGGGGNGEGELLGATGYGGTGGTWEATTLTVGVDIEAGTPITVVVAPRNPDSGPGGTTPYFDHGFDGLPTTFTWTKPDTTTGTLTCAGGFGGNHTLGLSHNTLSFGLGPGDETYNGVTYVGGAERITAGPGNFPGGGGWGAQPFEYGQPGAAGVAVIVERQT